MLEKSSKEIFSKEYSILQPFNVFKIHVFQISSLRIIKYNVLETPMRLEEEKLTSEMKDLRIFYLGASDSESTVLSRTHCQGKI